MKTWYTRWLMSTHAPLDLWFAVGAAMAVVLGLVVGALRALGSSPGGEHPGALRALGGGRVLAGLMLWFAADVALAAIGVFAATVHRPVPIIAIGIVLPIVVGVWLLSRAGALSRLVDSIPTHTLIDVQTYRVVGAVFILAWAEGRMPAIFALTAGLGDVAVGVAAPLVAARVEDVTGRSRQIAVIWNVAGIADLVVAVMLGAATSPTPLWPTLLGHPNPLISRLPFVLIPIFAVPLSVTLHIVALRRLSRRGHVHERPPANQGSSQARPAMHADTSVG